MYPIQSLHVEKVMDRQWRSLGGRERERDGISVGGGHSAVCSYRHTEGLDNPGWIIRKQRGVCCFLERTLYDQRGIMGKNET